MDDRDLEAMFRSTLHDRADDVADTGSVANRSALARVAVRRRRRIAGTFAVVAAVTVVTPIAVVAATHDPAPAPTTAHPSSWRAESYNGIQLWVPPSWGWGMTPSVTSAGLRQCGFGAYAGSGSTGDLRYSKADAAPPYVGRPMAVGKECPTPPRSSVAHVWFDSPLPVGTSGTATTISVHGLTPFKITVADADAAERGTILNSVQQVDTDAHGCPARQGVTGRQQRLSAAAVKTSVCLYYAPSGSTAEPAPSVPSYLVPPYLYYSTTVSTGSATVAAAIRARGPLHRPEFPFCFLVRGLSAVTLTLRAGHEQYTYVVPMSVCQGQSLTYNATGDVHLVTKSSVRLWAVDAVSLYAGGGSVGNPLTPYLPH